MNNNLHINIEKDSNILVTGAGHGIGLALVKKLVKDRNNIVFATYRNKDNASELFEFANNFEHQINITKLDTDIKNDYKELLAFIQKYTNKLDGIINCIGMLHQENLKPEKRLEDISSQNLIESFKANTIPTALLAKNLLPLLKNKQPALFVSLSARIGSIDDNRSGGWYSYRASKSALNMMIKSISIELNRLRCNTLTLAIHPGTTITKLSEPFTKNFKLKLHTADETANNILSVISQRSLEDNGGFFDWRGESIKW